MAGKKRSKRELRAMAYALCDIIETRALALMERAPGIDKADAMAKIVMKMPGNGRGSNDRQGNISGN